MKKILSAVSIASVLFIFSGCTSSGATPVVKSPNYKQGEQDGCTTAGGAYTKNSDMFRNDTEYADGWYAGRKNCNPVNSKK